MIIHDTYIAQIEQLLSNKGKETDIRENVWEIKNFSDYILDSETALELGSTKIKNANLNLCTSEKSFDDKIVIIGNDIQKLKGRVDSFSKVVIVSLKEEADENTLFRSIKAISRARLGLNLKGTMLKSTTSDSLECFRISKESYKKGFDFSILGSTLINKLKTFDEVKNVQIYYIVENEELTIKLLEYQEKIQKVTGALNHVFDDIELDCGSCTIKEICDEVEGMRESHKKMYKK